MDRGAWQATVHLVAKSRTRLKQLSTAQHIALKPLLNLFQYCFCFMFCFFGSEVCGILAPPTPKDRTGTTSIWKVMF